MSRARGWRCAAQRATVLLSGPLGACAPAASQSPDPPAAASEPSPRAQPRVRRRVETEDGPRVELLDAQTGEWVVAGKLVGAFDLDHMGPRELLVIDHHHWSGTNVVVYRRTDTGWRPIFRDYVFELRMTLADDGGCEDLLVFRDDEARWRSTGELTCTRFGWDPAAGAYLPTTEACSAGLGALMFPSASPVDVPP